jgi:glycosyltransferase involved in cell wall biosynthesis
MLSVVVPVFDERDNLEPLVDELAGVLDTLGEAYEIILVNDGSRDGSDAVVDRLVETRKGIRAVHFRANRGQTAALAAGFRRARGEYVATMDADLQNDPRDLPKLLAALDGHDAAIGYRALRRDPWARAVQSRVARAVRRRMCGDDVIDTGCALKVFRRESLLRIKLYTGLHRFLPILIELEGGSFVQLPVRHRSRRSGRSKYGAMNRAWRALEDVLAVRWMKRRALAYEVIRDDP